MTSAHLLQAMKVSERAGPHLRSAIAKVVSPEREKCGCDADPSSQTGDGLPACGATNTHVDDYISQGKEAANKASGGWLCSEAKSHGVQGQRGKHFIRRYYVP